MLIITIKQGKEKSLLSGDPWIYLSAIEKVEGRPQERGRAGATAVVQSSARQFLARAAYNAKSQIAARVWTLREDEPVDHAMMKRRVQAAVARRAVAVRGADPQALALVIDGDVAAVESGQFDGEHVAVVELGEIDRRHPPRRRAAEQALEPLLHGEQVVHRIPGHGIHPT